MMRTIQNGFENLQRGLMDLQFNRGQTSMVAQRRGQRPHNSPRLRDEYHATLLLYEQ
jgi:hypothetical protein